MYGRSRIIKFSQKKKKDRSWKYCNDPKFSERQFRANSADPDQTAPRGAV